MKDKIEIGHFYDRNYSKLIQGAELALCLFSKQNKIQSQPDQQKYLRLEHYYAHTAQKLC